MSLNEEDTRMKLLVVFLSITMGVGTLLQFLENHKIDDEPVRIPYIPTSTITSSSYIGTTGTTTL